MRVFGVAALCVALGGWLSVTTVAAQIDASTSGAAHVVDGDTLTIGQMRFRLQGVDAPETDQTCLNEKSERWACGIAARDRLAEHIAKRPVTCSHVGQDAYKRTLAICTTGGEDLNAWLVSEGLAMAYVQYSKQYMREETAARDRKRGLWAGAFVAPWDFRHRSKETTILGAVTVPVSAQAALTSTKSEETAPSSDCTIKGNVNRKGERIYHLSGQMNYAHVNMSKGTGERWFCNEDEAQAAGWRRAAR